MAIQDDAKNFLLSALSRAGGDLPSLQMEWLATQGYTRGTIDDRWQAYLAANAYYLPEGLSRLLVGLNRAIGNNWTPNLLFQSGDILLWYDPSDLTTMFTNTTGTTQVAADGDSVALMLDKGGLYDGRGVVNRLLRTQEFSGSPWVKRGTCAVTADATTAPDGSLTADLTSGIGAVSTNDIYQLNASVGALAAPAVLSIYIKRVSTSGTLTFQNSHNSVRGEYTVDMSLLSDDWERITPDHPAVTVVTSFSGHTAGVIGLLIGATAGAPLSAYFWGAQIEPGATVTAYQANGATVGGPGYHRIQATGTSMPKYKTGPNPAAAENSPELVTNGTFDADTDWTKAAGWTISGGQASCTTAGTLSSLSQSAAVFATPGRSYSISFDVVSVSGSGIFARFLADGSTIVASSSFATTGTKEFILEAPAFSSTLTFELRLNTSSSVTIDNVSVKEIPASAPYIHWLLYDGTDDSHATGTITWGTDEVAICAGVTKSSDAAYQMILEFGPSVSSNNGSFSVLATSGAGVAATNALAFGLRGTAATSYDATSYPSAASYVLTSILDISEANTEDENRPRVNGATPTLTATGGANAGTGNFGSYPLYFGRRAGTSLPFNGREYQTVIRSRLLSAAELSKLETFVAEKTGVIL